VLLSAAGLCAIRAVREPRERAVWVLFALAMGAYGLGFVYWAIFQEGAVDAPYPSAADGFWLSLFPFTFGALWLLARARLRGVNRRIWLDGLIVGLGLAALSASVVFRAVAGTTEGDTMAIITTLAYPVGDLLLLIMVAALFSTARRLADHTFQLLALGIGLLVITDSIWFVQVAHGTYDLNGALDLGWPVAMVLIGAAAWQPRGPRGLAPTDTSITLPTILVTLCVGLLVYDHFVRMETLGVLLAGATVVAAVWRLVLTYRSSADLLRVTQRAALTDELTQLGNRAKLVRDLEVVLEGRGQTLLAFFDLDGFKNYNDTYGHPAGDALLRRLARNLMASMPTEAEAYRMGGDEFCALIPWHGDTDVAVVVAPACEALVEQGEGFSVKTSWGHAIVPVEASTASHALSIADHRLYEDKTSGRVSAQRQSHQVLKRVLEQRDHMLGIHVDDVAALAERTARDLGLDDKELERVVLAAELHDIGKSAIPDAILFKPGPLDPEEWEFMQRHTVIGERILAGASSLMAIAHVVRSSHERFDGKGYPDGLAGEAIPVAARIVFVCDAFDAMTSDRTYKSAISAESAIAELRACAGTQFDPAVVDAFVRAFERSPRVAA
jgi:diguanylate cyclase (GGDEF)-like protein